MTVETLENPVLRRMVDDLKGALGDRLLSVALYGSAARGDYVEKTSDLNLLLVLSDLSPATLEALGGPLDRWRRKRQPTPRFFTPELIADSADVFPIEFLDIRESHRVLHGEDPLSGLEVHSDHLRLQCERELREKMMRLREGYAEAHARRKQLERLLTSSYSTFVALFRGCLNLLGREVPVHNEEVVTAFCQRAGIERAPFSEIERLKRGEASSRETKDLFRRYYEQLSEAVRHVDRFASRGEHDA
jgi:predicted nucleotidyltransferase